MNTQQGGTGIEWFVQKTGDFQILDLRQGGFKSIDELFANLLVVFIFLAQFAQGFNVFDLRSKFFHLGNSLLQAIVFGSDLSRGVLIIPERWR